MTVWARVEFEKLKEDTRAYIVAEIIKQKKDDKTYISTKPKHNDDYQLLYLIYNMPRKTPDNVKELIVKLREE